MKAKLLLPTLSTMILLFLASCSKTEVADGADNTPNGKSCGEQPGISTRLDTAWDGDTTINF